MSSSISLEDLERLSKKSLPKRETSALVPIEIPLPANNETPCVSLALPVKRKKLNALEQIEETVGGRDHFIESLELSTLDKREAHFLTLLADPLRKNDTISTIAKDAGLKPMQILDLFRSAAFAKAHVISMSKLAEALPDVVDDIAAKAVDAKIQCPTCFGDGKDTSGDKCLQCSGRGEVMRFSDLDRQKIVLETAGLTKKSGGVNVNVNQQVGIINPASFFSKFVKDSDSTANDVIDLEPEPQND